MTDTNSQWIEMNLQRQRKMLEDKQKQKRQQSAGSVRTTMTPLSTGSSTKDFPVAFESSIPFAPLDTYHSSSSQSAMNNSSNNPPQLPVFPPRVHSTFRASDRDSPNSAYNNTLKQDLNKKLSEVNLSTCVGSDEEEALSPWEGREIALDHIPGDVLPDYDYIRTNTLKFVQDTAPENCLYKCVITRQKSGMDKGMFPTYFLHLEEPTNMNQKGKLFLLAARKRKKSTTANYLISADATNLSREADSYCAKVRSNALGTQFTIYDSGLSPKKVPNHKMGIRSELAAVIYETNVLGFKGPRKMTVIIPGIEKGSENATGQRHLIRPVDEKDTLLEKFRNNDTVIKVLNNKGPQWNDETQSYVLNFHGRVTQASVKNFQIIHKDSAEYIVMQFGRTSDDSFTMDFRYPLSPIQAFGIAMTSFHGKLACE
ncbi:unnamed protein product [Caenorhabditis sp. 36 PRJEB53466]|nr:unnamed protein product [Caenorhabditis sp. 36 PRJEB53466]